MSSSLRGMLIGGQTTETVSTLGPLCLLVECLPPPIHLLEGSKWGGKTARQTDLQAAVVSSLLLGCARFFWLPQCFHLWPENYGELGQPPHTNKQMALCQGCPNQVQFWLTIPSSGISFLRWGNQIRMTHRTPHPAAT